MVEKSFAEKIVGEKGNPGRFGEWTHALDLLPDPISLISRNLEVFWGNRAMKEEWCENPVGRKCHEAFFGLQNPCSPEPCHLRKAFEERRQHRKVRDKEGRERIFECRARLLSNGDAGDPSFADCALCVFREVTKEVRELETLRAQKARAEASDKAKGEFLAGLSHELRTPLNAIQGFGDLLDSMVDDPRLRSYLHSIQTASKSMKDLVEEVLQFSRIEAGKIELEYAPVDLMNLLDEVACFFEPKARQKGLRLAVEAENFASGLELDEKRLRQVLLNLVGNAVKFTLQGQVKIRASQIPRTASGRVDLAIAVEDTGVGIPKAQGEFLFEPFRQVGSKKSKEEGTGLGLAISKRLVERMNGTIEWSSSVGAGSTFEVRLRDVGITPSICERRTKAAETQRLRFRPQAGRVLIVDDIESNRRMMAAWLSRAGLDVLVAQNGEEAFRLSREARPDLVFMDLRMPVCDGFESLRQMRRFDETKDTPVIAVTASPSLQVECSAQDAGFQAVLAKPISVHTLFEQVNRYLPEKPNARPSECARTEETKRLVNRETPEKRGTAVFQSLSALTSMWEEFRGAKKMSRILEFARMVEKLAEDANVAFLSIYAQKLRKSVEVFDLEAVNGCLARFPDIVREMKKLEGKRQDWA